MAITLLIAGLIVDIWLLIIIYQKDVRKRLPWFAIYVTWGVLLQGTQVVVWAINLQLYVAVYWWMEAVAVVLIVGAVRESFLRIFRGFTAMPWFRWTVSGTIAAVVAYSAWKAIYHPPIQGNRLTSLVVGAEFLFRWGIAGMSLLTIVLTWLLKEPSESREDAVMAGFGITSGAFLAAAVCVSLFGKKYILFSTYVPSVGYFIAAFLWIWVFSRPVKGFGFDDFGIGPEDLLKLMRRYREDVRQVRGKP